MESTPLFKVRVEIVPRCFTAVASAVVFLSRFLLLTACSFFRTTASALRGVAAAVRCDVAEKLHQDSGALHFALGQGSSRFSRPWTSKLMERWSGDPLLIYIV